MKATFQLDDEYQRFEGHAAAVLNRMDQLAHEPTFVGHKLTCSPYELDAVAEFDQASDLLDHFGIIIDDHAEPTFNSQIGYVSNVIYKPVKEDAMNLNYESEFGIETTDGGALEAPGLFDGEFVEGDISYRGAIGHNSGDPLEVPGLFESEQVDASMRYVDDLPVMNWDEPKPTGKKNTGVKRLTGDDAPLDLPSMF